MTPEEIQRYEIVAGLRCPHCKKEWKNHGWNGGIEKDCPCVRNGNDEVGTDEREHSTAS